MPQIEIRPYSLFLECARQAHGHDHNDCKYTLIKNFQEERCSCLCHLTKNQTNRVLISLEVDLQCVCCQKDLSNKSFIELIAMNEGSWPTHILFCLNCMSYLD